MDRYCGQCANCNLNNKQKYGSKYWCQNKGKYVELTDKYTAKNCRNYIYDPEKDKDYKKKYRAWGLHIITAIYEIMGKQFDEEVLETLITKGTEYKNSDNGLKDTLFDEYDLVGPMIAKSIKMDRPNIENLESIYIRCLLIVFHRLKKEENKEALIEFIEMVKKQKKLYNIEGLIDLDYVLNVSIPLDNDPLAISFESVLGEGVINDFLNILNFINKSQNPEIKNCYDELSSTFFEINLSLDDYELQNFYRNYYCENIRELLKLIKIMENSEYVDQESLEQSIIETMEHMIVKNKELGNYSIMYLIKK